MNNVATRVYLGVGHGGTDPGAVSGIWIEKNLALEIVTHTARYLRECNVECMMSRTGDDSESVAAKIKECNAFCTSPYDYAVDFHLNAGGGDGSEAYAYHGSKLSHAFAQNMLDALQAVGQNTRGVKEKLNADGTDYFGFIRETIPVACLLEIAFIDTKDVEFVDTREERRITGEAIAKGILKTIGVPDTHIVRYTLQTVPVVHSNLTKEAADTLALRYKAQGVNYTITRQ